MPVLAGLAAGLFATFGLMAVGFMTTVAYVGGVLVGLLVAVTTAAQSSERTPRKRPWLAIAFAASGAGLLASFAVLDSQAGPCNVDDFTGCSSVGELAVFAWLFLMPTTAALGLILAIVHIARRS